MKYFIYILLGLTLAAFVQFFFYPYVNRIVMLIRAKLIMNKLARKHVGTKAGEKFKVISKLITECIKEESI